MKYILTSCFFVFSIFSEAQERRWLILPVDTVFKKEIQSITEISLFLAYRDTSKADTGAVNVQYYSPEGRLDSMSYRVVLAKNNYHDHVSYTYNDTGRILTQFINSSDNYFDSAFYADPEMTVVHNSYHSYRVHYYWENDSTWVEKRIEGKDTTLHRNRYYRHQKHSAFQYEYEFASMRGLEALNAKYTITHDPVRGYDSCRFYNGSGKLMMMIVHKNDSIHGIYQTEYFNYHERNARGFTTHYNSVKSMSDYMPISKHGKPSYVITETNTPNGLTKEIFYRSAKKHYTPVVLRYVYDYYY